MLGKGQRRPPALPSTPGMAGHRRGSLSSTNGKHTAIDDVRDALASSLRLREVVRAVQPPLARLLGGDHTAFGFLPGDAGGGITPGAPQEPGRIEWMASDDLP